jgi:hypothetical protein
MMAEWTGYYVKLKKMIDLYKNHRFMATYRYKYMVQIKACQVTFNCEAKPITHD